MSNSRRSPAIGFFGIAADRRAYLGCLYLLLSFPLGIVYFVFLVTGLSLGLGLIITLVGIPILVGVIAGSYGLAAFERTLAERLLGVNIRPVHRGGAPSGFWGRLRRLIASRATWKAIGYLFAKFPLGIASFVIVVTLLAVSLSLALAPIYYHLPGVVFGMPGGWQVDTMPEALVASVAGIGLLFGSLHAFKWMAWLSGRFARVALGGRGAGAMPETHAAPGDGEERGGSGEGATGD